MKRKIKRCVKFTKKTPRPGRPKPTAKCKKCGKQAQNHGKKRKAAKKKAKRRTKKRRVVSARKIARIFGARRNPNSSRISVPGIRSYYATGNLLGALRRRNPDSSSSAPPPPPPSFRDMLNAYSDAPAWDFGSSSSKDTWTYGLNPKRRRKGKRKAAKGRKAKAKRRVVRRKRGRR